jgi:hypothetical protein
MAFGDINFIGAAGNSTDDQASLTITTIADIAVGSLVVVVVGVDNRATGGGDDSATSGVTIGGHVATKARQNASNLAAQAGASCSMWWWVSDAAVPSGSSIVATFTTNTTSDASAILARQFSFAGGNTIVVENTNALANDAADPGSLDAATSNIECLRIRAIAGEASAALGDFVVTSGWTDWGSANSAASGTTSEIAVRAESIISTGTGAASDPSWGAFDNASVYVAFRENPTESVPLSYALITV